jgi:hypothetical protein
MFTWHYLAFQRMALFKPISYSVAFTSAVFVMCFELAKPVFRENFREIWPFSREKKVAKFGAFWRKAMPTGNLCEISCEISFEYGVCGNLPARL